MRKLKQFTIITLCLAIAFFVSAMANEWMFIGSSPHLRPNTGNYITTRLRVGLNSLLIRIGMQKKNENSKVATVADVEESLKNIPFTQISKGVYAKEDGVTSLTVIKTDELETIQYTFNIKGKIITVRVPKDLPYTEQQIRESIDR